ncbi:BQ2448_1700 [Microbotryum intermedium]|uniref:BQ2448_1700 protein n=1 Tax=Microbotryum intermedium TaxID=269621 RepID=A0A238FGY1_9BASI|nr:BQ2448_1700 [Microbotryum intermedium]
MVRIDITQSHGGTPRGRSPVDTPTQSRSPTARPVVDDHASSPTMEALSLHLQLKSGHFPPEIVYLIIQHLYYTILPPPEPFPSPDPYLHLLPRENMWTLPRLAPPRPEQLRKTFRNLALVDKTWGDEATRALWRKISFGFPKSWEGVLRVVDEYEHGQRMDRRKKDDPSGSDWSSKAIAGLDASTPSEDRGRPVVPNWTNDTQWAKLAGPLADTVGKHERDDSSHSNVETTVGGDEGQVPISLNAADSPLLYTKTISFSRFRTAGMSRSLRQGSHERFVTPHRLLKLLRGTRLGKGPLDFPGAGDDEDDSIMSESNYGDDHRVKLDDLDEFGGPIGKVKQTGRLEGLAFTEFMDSALTKAVLDELLFRGGYLAEYEESEDFQSHPEGYFDHHESSSKDSGAPLSSPFPSPFVEAAAAPSIRVPFRARHLQSSQSRSPMGVRRSSLSSTVVSEADDQVVAMEDDESDEEEAVSQNHEGRLTRRPDHSPEVRGRSLPQRLPFQRRSSGAAYDHSPAVEPGSDEIEERGRERTGRSAALSGRGRSRFNRSLVPPSAFVSRSSSVPAPFHERGLAHPPFSSRVRGTSLDTERSSSVAASALGRRAQGQTKLVQILEGSKHVKAIRALDLCGCISTVFVRAIEECIGAYRLGPPSLLPSATSSITAIDENDDLDDSDWPADVSSRHPSTSSRTTAHSQIHAHSVDGKHRKLRRIYFPHFRRLGLASSLLPTHLLTSFVLSFPYLTHLDLAGTLASPELLQGLALAGQAGPGGRKMRLKALNLARCRLVTGSAVLGLFCGDCPPFTSHAGMDANEAWGFGEVVSGLVDCSLYGDAAHTSPLSRPELRLVLTISPAFTSGRLRTLDLSSTPLTDALLLEHFPPQPHLIELGLAGCRAITMRGVAQFLIEKAPGVEVLDLSNAVPGAQIVAPSSAQRRATLSTPTLSIFELHTVLLQTVASVSVNLDETDDNCQILLALRKTNLRVVELDEKALDAVQGGAGNWKPIWGKGRRGWYVDVATSSVLDRSPAARGPRKLVHLSQKDPHRQALLRLYEQNGSVATETGWHARKMEVIRGDGMMGREEGLYAYQAFSV